MKKFVQTRKFLAFIITSFMLIGGLAIGIHLGARVPEAAFATGSGEMSQNTPSQHNAPSSNTFTSATSATPDTVIAASTTLTPSTPTGSITIGVSTPLTATPSAAATGVINPTPTNGAPSITTAPTPTPPAVGPDDNLESNPNPSVTLWKEPGAVLGRVFLETNGEACGNPGGTCLMPYQTTIRVYDANTFQYIRTIAVDASGSFAFKQKGGDYLLIPEVKSGETSPRADAQRITIVDENTVEVTITYYRLLT